LDRHDVLQFATGMPSVGAIGLAIAVIRLFHAAPSPSKYHRFAYRHARKFHVRHDAKRTLVDATNTCTASPSPPDVHDAAQRLEGRHFAVA